MSLPVKVEVILNFSTPTCALLQAGPDWNQLHKTYRQAPIILSQQLYSHLQKPIYKHSQVLVLNSEHYIQVLSQDLYSRN